jgi:transcriptional regulator with XRE-family HTH domain
MPRITTSPGGILGNIGQRIREEREAAKITQEELARRIARATGRSYVVSQVSKIETSQNRLDADLVPVYAAALGVTVARLFGESPYRAAS